MIAAFWPAPTLEHKATSGAINVFRHLADAYRATGNGAVMIVEPATPDAWLGGHTRTTPEAWEPGACDLLFVWNGALAADKDAIARARDAGAGVVFAELGWFPQAASFYLDSEGVGPLASIAAWNLDAPLDERKSKRLDARLAMYHGLAPPHGDEPGGHVFVPLQVECDSQVVLGSKRIKTMGELLRLVAAVTPGDVPVVAKVHPHGEARGNAPLPTDLGPNVTITNGGDCAHWIRGARAVVTINSTVGLEALTYDKPVVTLGDSFYAREGVTIRSEPGPLKPAIARALDEGHAGPKARALLARLFDYQWTATDLADPERVVARVGAINTFAD